MSRAGPAAHRLGHRQCLARCTRPGSAFGIIELPVVGPGRVRSACRQSRPAWPRWLPGLLFGDVRRPAQACYAQAEWNISGPDLQLNIQPAKSGPRPRLVLRKPLGHSAPFPYRSTRGILRQLADMHTLTLVDIRYGPL